MKKKSGPSLSTILLFVVFFVGLSLLLYPTISEYWNSTRQSRVITQYSSQVANLDNDRYDAMLAEARAYNETVQKKGNQFTMSGEDMLNYTKTLDVTGTGILGYLEIPKIDSFLAIYHTVEETVLQSAVGHVEWSTLPVGGKGTHAVLSGHRGLPSAKLFTHLDQMHVGDQFLIHVLDETFTYEVDQILIVEPENSQDLLIIEGQDLVTLLTCTPYGINSHRLLVRGHRVDNAVEEKTVRVTADAIQIEPVLMAPLVASPMLLILLVWVMLPGKKKK